MARGVSSSSSLDISRRLSRLSAGALAWLAVVTVIAIALVDRSIGPAVSMVLLYAAPVAAVSWYGNRDHAFGVAVVATGAGFISELTHVHAHGFTLATAIWNASMRFGAYWIVVAAPVSLKRALAAERQLARTDPLTELPNFRSFTEAAWRELSRMRRSGRPLSVVSLDLDDFKAINDELGHPAGDQVLRDLGKVLREGLRPTDVASRLGGDEFAVLLPDTSAEAARLTANRLREQVRLGITAQGRAVTVSAGVATFVEAPASIHDMISEADESLYAAKHAGKDIIDVRVVEAEGRRWCCLKREVRTSTPTGGGAGPPTESS